MKRAPIMLGLDEDAWFLWEPTTWRHYEMYESMAWGALRVTSHR